MIKYLNPVSHRESWLAGRSVGLGGSEAGVLLGWDQYRTVVDVWQDKTGLIRKDLSSNPYVYAGSMLEPTIAQMYAHKRGQRVLARDVWGRPVIFHPEEEKPATLIPDTSEYIALLNPLHSSRFPWMRCNVDAFAMDEHGAVAVGLEIKTGGERTKKKWSWLAPLPYVAQVWHNSVVAREVVGHPIPWDLVALIGGQHLGIVRVPYDMARISIMLERGQKLWACVHSKAAPEPNDFGKVPWPFMDIEDGEVVTMSIPIKAPGSRTRILPPKGIHRAVICDVVDRGMVESEWQGEKKMKHKVSVHFLLTPKIPATYVHPYNGEKVDCAALELDGRNFGTQQWFTASLDPRAGYRKLVESLLERTMTREELDDHDAESMVGKQVQLVIKHKQVEKGGSSEWYANIDSVLPAEDDAGAVAVPGDYVRIKDRAPRDGQSATATTATSGGSVDDDDDELPF